MIKVDRSKYIDTAYPEVLKGSWIYFAFPKNNPNFDGLCQVYFNNKYESGSIFYGDYLLNDYPECYATWGKPDENMDVIGDRSFVKKELRKTGVGTALMIEGFHFLKYMGKNLKLYPTTSTPGRKLWAKATGEELDATGEDNSEYSIEIQNFEHMLYPDIFFYKKKADIF